MGFSFPFPVRFPSPLAFFLPGRFLLPDFVFGMIPASELPLSRWMGSGWKKLYQRKAGAHKFLSYPSALFERCVILRMGG
jgi:hypothetical protein